MNPETKVKIFKGTKILFFREETLELSIDHLFCRENILQSAQKKSIVYAAIGTFKDRPSDTKGQF